MLLNVIPNKWDYITAYYVQQQQMANTITFTAIQTTILAEFEHSGGNHNHQSHTADKISAVKRKGKLPNFQKQKATADNNYTANQEAGPSNQKKRCANHQSKKGKGRNNSHQHFHIANRLEKVELGQLQLAPALQHPMITLQPSRVGLLTMTIASIKPSSITYVSKSTNLPTSTYTDAPFKLGPNTLQGACSLAQRIGVTQTPENLRALDALREH